MFAHPSPSSSDLPFPQRPPIPHPLRGNKKPRRDTGNERSAPAPLAYPGKPLPTTNHYGVAHRILRQIASDGRETRFNYKLTGACITNISTPGVRCSGAACPTEDSWDNHQSGWRLHGGQVIATTVTQADGSTDTWRYNGDKTPSEHINAQGQSTTWQYDANRRMTQQKDPLGRTTKYSYDSNSNPIQTIDPLQRVTRSTYDGKWNTLTSLTRYNDPTPLGSANPQVTLSQYNNTTGVLATTTSPLNQITTYAYTPQGQLNKITAPNGSITQLAYNPTGDLAKITDPLNRATSLNYDNAGRPIQTTNPKGYNTQTAYNGSDQLTQSTDPLGGTTTITYDTAGRPSLVTDPLSHPVQTNTYDDGDRLKTQANALNQTTTNQYDSAGRLTQSTTPKGQVTTYSYDSSSRLASITRPEGTQSLSYDLVGRILRIADNAGSLEYTYDAGDRITRHTQKQGTRTTVIDYQYDPLDRMTSRTLSSTDSSGPSLTADTTLYQYDNGNRLTKITYQGQGTKNEVTTYSYDTANRLTSKTLPNGIQITYQYDAASQLTQIEYLTTANVTLDKIQYQYDANGQITQRTSLNAIGKDDTPYTAIYDAANRMTSLTLNPGTATPTTYNLSYDANGNLTQKQNANTPGDISTYQWDSQNRLTSISAPGTLATFQYDISGRRTRKTVNGQVTDYLYDGQQAIGEIRASDIAINLTGLNLDEAIARYTRTIATGTEQSSSYLTDILGSVVAQAASDQTIQCPVRMSGAESRRFYSTFQTEYLLLFA